MIKTLFVVVALMLMFGECGKKPAEDNTKKAGKMSVGTSDGVIEKITDRYEATNVAVSLCDNTVTEATAKWEKTGTDVMNKKMKIEFDEKYACILDTLYQFNPDADPIEITIKKGDFCACDLSLREAMRDSGIAAEMSIWVDEKWETVDGPNSPPRIIIGGGISLIDGCCPNSSGEEEM